MTNVETMFREQVAAFRRWAKEYCPTPCFGEWETEYDDRWLDVWAAVRAFLDSGPPELWEDDLVG